MLFFFLHVFYMHIYFSVNILLTYLIRIVSWILKFLHICTPVSYHTRTMYTNFIVLKYSTIIKYCAGLDFLCVTVFCQKKTLLFFLIFFIWVVYMSKIKTERDICKRKHVCNNDLNLRVCWVEKGGERCNACNLNKVFMGLCCIFQVFVWVVVSMIKMFITCLWPTHFKVAFGCIFVFAVASQCRISYIFLIILHN